METLGKLVVILGVCAVSFWAGLSMNGRKEAANAKKEREQMQQYLESEARAASWLREARSEARASRTPTLPPAAPPKPDKVKERAAAARHDPYSVQLPCEPSPVNCEGPACYYDVRADVGACSHLRHGR